MKQIPQKNGPIFLTQTCNSKNLQRKVIKIKKADVILTAELTTNLFKSQLPVFIKTNLFVLHLINSCEMNEVNFCK